MDPAPTTDAVPSRLELARWPAIVTLGVTGARLALEFGGAPAWLARKEAGGLGAVFGIAWLPFLFGPWFAFKLARVIRERKKQLARTFTTLVVYGYLARLPVFALYFLDVALGWGTHYGAFPSPEPGEPAIPEWKKVMFVGLGQLVFWPIVWTGGLGTLAGWVALLIAGPKPAPAAASGSSLIVP